LGVSTLFVPTEFWFVAFENVSYRTMCEHIILCFTAQIAFRHYKYLKKQVARWQLRKHRFMSGLNVFTIAVRVSMIDDVEAVNFNK
jgi:hypothetical protein